MVADEPDEEDKEKIAIMVNGVMVVAKEGNVVNAMGSMRPVREPVRLRSHSSIEWDQAEVEEEEDMRTQKESSKKGHDHRRMEQVEKARAEGVKKEGARAQRDGGRGRGGGGQAHAEGG